MRLAGLSDELLAGQAGRGSERAFATLYERYHQPLYRYCRSIVRDDADAQDALQSTFARALSALKRQQRNAPLRPWLFRIAHNEAISLIRRRGRDSVAEAEDTGTYVQASAEEEAAERARWAELVDDLAELPVRLRGALLLRELSGLSHEEIAVALGGTVGAAKQAIFEARQALAEIAEGRTMECEDLRRRISEGDGRVLRGRRVRAHLRDCPGCEAFAAAIPARQAELRAFAPVLAPAAAAVLLRRAIGTSSGHGGTGLASSAAAGVPATSSPVAGSSAAAAGAAGKVAAVAVVSKGLAVAAVIATAGVGVAGLARLVEHSHSGSSAPTRSGRSPHHNAGAIPGTGRTGGSAGRGAAHSQRAGALAGSGPGTSGTAAGGTAAAGTATTPGHGGHGAAGSGSGTTGASGHGHGLAHGGRGSSNGHGASSHGGRGSGHTGTNSHGAAKSAPPAKGHPHAASPASPGPGSGQARGSTRGGKGIPATPTNLGGSAGGSHAGTSHPAPAIPAARGSS